MILCLETATNLCSVALCDKAGVFALKESNESKSHASLLTVYISDILADNNLKTSDLDAVAVSKGPGSYTGLRIGVSVAKGIAYGASIPLIGIETTLSMFHGIIINHHFDADSEKNSIFCPMLDARRMEVYYGLYSSAGNKIKEISAEVITEDTFSTIPEPQRMIFFGDGALKCKETIKKRNSVFAADFKISASHMCKPASAAFKNRSFEDVAYFEPLYLKDFITSKARKNVLGK